MSLRLALRRLAQSPGFSALAIVTLALGIGASTALFSLVNAVLLRPLAYERPGELVWLREAMPAFGSSELPISAYHFATWRERATGFSGLAVFDWGTLTLTGRDQPQQVKINEVSTNFFQVLAVQPALGRSFAAEEEVEGRNHVVVISDGLWHREFGAAPDLIGHTIELDHEAHTVIGILPAGFRYPHAAGNGVGSARPTNPDVFRPKVFSAEELGEKLGRHNYAAIGRLKPGVSLEQATAELDQIDAAIVREAGEGKLVLRARLLPLQEAVVGASRTRLVVLFGAVTAVLMIGCVNLMNFLLAQAETRKHEAAIRQALGATPGRLLGQALLESMLIAGMGGAAGVLCAKLGLTLFLRHLPSDLPRLAEVDLDGRVLAFALAVTLLTGLLFGAIPAWRLARSDAQQALGSARTIAGSGGRTITQALVATEVALSVLLLMTAALLGTSFLRLLRTDTGVHTDRLLTAEVVIPYTKYHEGAQRTAFFEEALARLGALPGVTGVAMSNALPMQGETWVDKAAVAGDTRRLEEKPNTNVRFVNGDYFQTLTIAVRGRTFTAADRNRKVAVISEALARVLWPAQDPIGRRVERWAGDEYEVIGVAADVRVAADREPVPTMYRPYWDWPPARAVLAVRTTSDPRAAAGSFRAAIRSIDRDVPVPSLRTMGEITAGSLQQQRFQMLLAGSFAAAALTLTALGISGVVAYAVNRRRRELGIRLALGARPAAICQLVVRQGMRPVWFGLAVGLGGSLALAQVVRSLLYATNPADPRLLALVAVVLAAVAAFACYLPGRRATAVDPIETLRAE